LCGAFSGEINEKSTVDEIWQRFDADVEEFSNLETGQSATVDAPFAMALVAEAAAVTTPHARHVLDVGCGAGNYTLKLLKFLPDLDATLIDLSQLMLDRARERLSRATAGRITTFQADIRVAELPDEGFDIVLAAAVLHHLRTDREWQDVFRAFHRALRPGGSVWVFDLVDSSIPALGRLLRQRYGEYLTRLKNESYRDHAGIADQSVGYVGLEVVVSGLDISEARKVKATWLQCPVARAISSRVIPESRAIPSSIQRTIKDLSALKSR
jgi:tRNA (cmo5U34)-methyltransferase